MSILEKKSQIREYINSPSKGRFEILSDKKRWNTVCASLDAINDTQGAIDDYKSKEEISYLELSGLLQSMFLQSDASGNLHDALEGINRSNNNTYKFSDKLKDIREIRNKSIGHPTKRTKGSYVVYMPGIKKGFFNLALYEGETTFQKINLIDLINVQEVEIGAILDTILDYIKTITMKHHEKFTKSLLDDFLDLDHTIQKIYEGPQNGQYQTSLEYLKKIITDLKKTLNEMYGSLSEIDEIERSIKKIEITLGIFPICSNIGDEYIVNHILADSLKKETTCLKEYLKEIDREFDLKSP